VDAVLTDTEARLRHARTLVEIGDLDDAEAEIQSLLEDVPEDLTALDLLAKIKHMRGELSDAIACWSRVRSHTLQGEAGLLRLASLMQGARQHASGASDFVVVGPFQLWRKPAAHLELESVFRLFLDRRVHEAEAACEQIAAKYRGRDQDVAKLAVLALAWIAELSGELDRARQVLEELGRERGFETDVDRALALARVYEKIGTPELLDGAIHIFEHLARQGEKISTFGHLTGLYRRVGRDDDARRAAERFLRVFRRRMHRVSFEEAVHAASVRYLPLSRLARLPDSGERRGFEGRAGALALALRGEVDEARTRLEAGSEVLDLKYRGDVAALDGSDDAVALYLQAAERDPEDLRILGWLLDRDEPAVVAYFRRPQVASRAAGILEAAVRAHPRRAMLWRHLARLRTLLGETEEAERCAERAAAFEDAWHRKAFPVGRALAAAVYHFSGKPHGLVHEVWAARRPVEPGRGGFLEDVLGNLTPEMIQGVRNTFLSVREFARARWPHRTGDILDHVYSYKVTKDDEPSGGLSAGLPSALALLSVFLDRPLPQTLASSGILVADAHDVLVLRPVGDAEYKVRGAYNRNLQTLVLPEGNRGGLDESPLVPPEVSREVVRYASRLDDALALAFGEDVWLD
jgi:tetratricopeptide (TPR) repeat protein